MTNDFHKFPRTPHPAVLADSVIRDDKVMSASEQEMFLHHELVVEEKVDSANLGISFDRQARVRCQNRGSLRLTSFLKNLPAGISYLGNGVLRSILFFTTNCRTGFWDLIFLIKRA